MSGVARDLVLGSETLARRPGPLQLMDAALLSVRRASFAQLLVAWLSALPLGCVVLLFYYLERVEGLAPPRWPFALGFVLAYWFRFQALAQIARQFAAAQRPGVPLSAAPRLVDVLCTGSVSALGLWLWAWPAVALARLSPFALLGAVPLLALRGAVAPSQLARSACAPERGFAAFTRAVEDTRGVRALMFGVEWLFCCAFLALFANLYALGAALLMLGSSVLGLDVAFLSAFLAPDNGFVPLLLMAIASLLLEPLRAALSALAFTEARGRKDGADLHSAIDALRAQRVPRALAVALITLGACTAHAVVSAQTAPQPDRREQHAEPEPHDEAVRSQVSKILQRAEFHDFEAEAGGGFHLRELFDRWLGRKSSPQTLPESSPRFELQLPAWVVVCLALFLFGLVTLSLIAETRERRTDPRPAVPSPVAAPAVTPTPLPAAPVAALDAAALASAGRYREALRAIYLSTLYTLDRARVIRFEAARTNGQYLAALPNGPMRHTFEAITLSFEHTWYGAAAAGSAEYERARQLAAQLEARLESAP